MLVDEPHRPANVARACRLDGAVEGQQVGLIGDAFDGIDDGTNFIAVPGHIAAATGQHIDLFSSVRCSLDMTRDFLGGCGLLTLMPAYSASTKVICFIKNLDRANSGILPTSASLLQGFPKGIEQGADDVVP
ncbi:hypothetical protein D3C84_108640 [compost metagenome]